MRALLLTGSQLTDSMRLDHRAPLGRSVTAFLRVQIPEGNEADFRALCQPYTMRPPGRIQLGCEAPADDGHPGRART